MAKFTKENMYNWVKSPEDVKKLRELDAKAGAIISEKVKILKKASNKYGIMKKASKYGKKAKAGTGKIFSKK